jgi:LemA protein
MSDTQLAVLAAGAVLVFWMLGAYNRLVELRNAIGAAWQLVDDVLKRRGEAIQQLVAGLREPLAAEHGALDTLVVAERQLRSAADALGARPLMAPRAAALVGAEAALAAAASRVLSLQAQGAAGALAPHRAVLDEATARLAFVRQLFNDAVAAYNAAARQFPTRLLTRLYGFGTAGRI